MDDNNLWANLYTQHHSEVDGHGVWHYLVDTSIGQINVVEYEGMGMEIKRKIFDGYYEKAEREYIKVCKKLAEGKY